MTQCYDWNSDTSKVELLANVWSPCPSGDTCCLGTDECLDYNLCTSKSTYNKRAGSYSGYYVARCTDPTFTDPACQKVCNAPGPPDAVYNSTSSQWSCCGDNSAGDVSCDDPTTEYFQAPAPAALVVIQSGTPAASTQTLVPGSKTASSSSATSAPSTVVVTSSTSSQSTTSNPSATTTPNTNQASSSTGLSSGAQAGIGIGVALGVLAIIAVVVFLLFRRKRRNTGNRGANYDTCPEYKAIEAPSDEKVTKIPNYQVELPSDSDTSRHMVKGHPVHEIGSSG